MSIYIYLSFLWQLSTRTIIHWVNSKFSKHQFCHQKERKKEREREEERKGEREGGRKEGRKEGRKWGRERKIAGVFLGSGHSLTRDAFNSSIGSFLPHNWEKPHIPLVYLKDSPYI